MVLYGGAVRLFRNWPAIACEQAMGAPSVVGPHKLLVLMWCCAGRLGRRLVSSAGVSWCLAHAALPLLPHTQGRLPATRPLLPCACTSKVTLAQPTKHCGCVLSMCTGAHARC